MMNQRLVRMLGGIVVFFVLVFAAILIYDNHLHKRTDLNNPSLTSSYRDVGYYKIDPDTILTSLNNGAKNVFVPLQNKPQEEVANIPIRWTQTDILGITSALGESIWGDPMDLEDWSVYSITLEGSCDSPIGFDFANITYFKTVGETYTTRVIMIEPTIGVVTVGNGGTYSKPILQEWNSVDLLGSKISAYDALQITSEDVKSHFQFKNKCGVIMGTPENNNPKNWYLHVFGASDSVVYIVNLDTGSFTFQKVNK